MYKSQEKGFDIMYHHHQWARREKTVRKQISPDSTCLSEPLTEALVKGLKYINYEFGLWESLAPTPNALHRLMPT